MGWLDALQPFVPGSGDFAALGAVLLRLVSFIAIAVSIYGVGRAFQWAVTALSPGIPTSARILFSKMLGVTGAIVGIWAGLVYVYGFDPVGVFATLGIVSLALGFGLQNTVANMAAGVSLSLDRPFDVGDRIQVGQTWGDVLSIGFRSTSIRTTSGELVVIPNALLDTQEVWNYSSRRQRELRLEISFGISYDSSISLAEDLALRSARDTPGVLAYPSPKFVVRGMGADGIDLQLRCWIGRADDKATVSDGILRRIKARFDEQGVHFPFPQRTLSYLKEMEPAAQTPQHLSEEHAGKPVVMALVRSPLSSAKVPDFIVEFAQYVDARIVYLHVRPTAAALHVHAGQMALNACMQAAQSAGVPAEAIMETGDLPNVAARASRRVGAKVVLLVRHSHNTRGWMRSDQRAILAASEAPVQFLEADTPPSEKSMAYWKARLWAPEVVAAPEHDGTDAEHSDR